jgi:hypothetical protein
LTVKGAEWLTIGFHRSEHFLLVSLRIKRFAADLAPDNIHCDHIIPLPDQEMLKLNGLLRADPPALTAPGAFGHIVLERSPIIPVFIVQGRSRTIFNT